MGNMHISLFGKLRIHDDELGTLHLEPRRAAELFCYLLLYRDRLHEREKLATLLWPDAPAGHAKRYLRQTLWQLQSTLNHVAQPESRLLYVDYERLGINPQAKFGLDTAALEQSFAAVENKPGEDFCEQQAAQVCTVVQLYQGELLDGWYQDWVIYERERLQSMYMALLDKLLTYSEAHGEYEAGLGYGVQILRYDRAREQTHRQLMRVHYRAGNRSAAIHQYESCVAALRDELDVAPAKSTVALYKQICAEHFPETSSLFKLDPTCEPHNGTAPPPSPANALIQLEQMQMTLAHLQDQVAQLAQNLRQAWDYLS